MEYARNIIPFLFEHEHEGYDCHTDCTVPVNFLSDISEL